MGLSMKMSLMVTWTMEDIVLYNLSFSIIDSVGLAGLWEHPVSHHVPFPGPQEHEG